MKFPEREPYVFIESRQGSLYLSVEDRVEEYDEVVGSLDDLLLDEQDSARLIVEVREAMTDE